MSLATELAKIEARLRGARADEAADAHESVSLQAEVAKIEAAIKHVDHSQPIPRAGVDYAFEPHPTPAQLRAAHATFVGRYLTGAGKALNQAEAKQLSREGLDLFAIFESSGQTPRLGFDAGVHDAKAAGAAMHALGAPATRPVYFTCDFDAAGENAIGAVMEYVRGCVHELGWERVGLYAGLGPIEAAHAEHRCPYLWQTLAWSGGRWSPHAQLRQDRVNRYIGAANVDSDVALAHDFGQWRI